MAPGELARPVPHSQYMVEQLASSIYLLNKQNENININISIHCVLVFSNVNRAKWNHPLVFYQVQYNPHIIHSFGLFPKKALFSFPFLLCHSTNDK